MRIVRHAEARRTETPAAVMTTLASPTQGGADAALWRVDMGPGQQSPPHVIDTEQVWTVLDGQATLDLDGDSCTLTAGDTVVVPGGAPRRLTTDSMRRFAAIVAGVAGSRAALVDGTDHGVPPWIE